MYLLACRPARFGDYFTRVELLVLLRGQTNRAKSVIVAEFLRPHRLYASECL
jgi:hypothetical protein